MGATLNLVVAIVLITGLYMHGMPEALYESQPAVIGTLDPNGAGTAAGLRLRDEIVAVGGVEVRTWRDMRFQVALNPGKRPRFRDSPRREHLDHPRADPRHRAGADGNHRDRPLDASRAREGRARSGRLTRRGMKAGDMLMSIEGREFYGGDGYRDFLGLIESSAGKPLAFMVDREGQRVDRQRHAAGQGRERRHRGEPGRRWESGSTPATAIPDSLEYNWKQSGLLFPP